MYTSFSASTEASKPSELEPGRSYELTGKVVEDSVSREGDGLRFRIRDRDGTDRCRWSTRAWCPTRSARAAR